MTIKEIREKSGLSQAKFSETYDIPVRSIQNWESGKRKCPVYLEKLLEKAVMDDLDIANIKLYQSKELLRELGALYHQLLVVMQKGNEKKFVTNPYQSADVFPAKYFTMLLPRAMSCGIPDELNQRIAQFMNFIDLDDWTNSMNKPCPVENRVYFLLEIGNPLKS